MAETRWATIAYTYWSLMYLTTWLRGRDFIVSDLHFCSHTAKTLRYHYLASSISMFFVVPSDFWTSIVSPTLLYGRCWQQKRLKERCWRSLPMLPQCVWTNVCLAPNHNCPNYLGVLSFLTALHTKGKSAPILQNRPPLRLRDCYSYLFLPCESSLFYEHSINPFRR